MHQFMQYVDAALAEMTQGTVTSHYELVDFNYGDCWPGTGSSNSELREAAREAALEALEYNGFPAECLVGV